MSYTEIFYFGKDGKANSLDETQNSHRGAMAVWDIMDKKYLEPLPRPSWMDIDDYNKRGYRRSSASMALHNGINSLKEVWDLWTSDKTSRIDKIVLGSTFDKVIVMRDNIDELIKAFQIFYEVDGSNTSLKEQADILIEAINDDDICDDICAIAWNQTSVNGDSWTNIIWDDEEDDYIPYNYLEQTDHFDLFKELNEMNL